MQPTIVIGELGLGCGGTDDRSRLSRLNYHADLLIVIAQSIERSQCRKIKPLPLSYNINYEFASKKLFEFLLRR